MKMPPHSDAELLARFMASRDQAAFAELVRRHGPMVLATCRRSLGAAPDVDDVFQSVFLVLARKAAALRDRAVLGPWLHTIAVRTARRAKAAAVRRLERERVVTAMPEPVGVPEEPDGWLPLLDEELQRLPEKYRRPLILCELQGHSRTDAARKLGLAEGTLSSRLARGREMLRGRLMRRGAAVTATGLAAILASETSAAVPSMLINSTATSACTGAISAPVAALTEGVLRTMFLARLKIGLVVALTLVICAGALTGVGVALPAEDKDAKKTDKEKLEGTWKIESARISGKDVEGQGLENLKERKYVFKGDTLTERTESKYRLDPSKKPKEITLEVSEGGARDRGTWKGIYEITGDDLTVCICRPGDDRPTKFESNENEPAILMKLKREK
jgi:RNA polymerase sigma factor (sigma-70 family)